MAVSLLAWHFEASLAVVVLLSLALGDLIIALVSTGDRCAGNGRCRGSETDRRTRTAGADAGKGEIAEAHRKSSVPNAEVVSASPYKELPRMIEGLPAGP